MITLLGIPFDFIGLTYFQTNKNVNVGDLVVCNTEHGTYLGKVKILRQATDEEMKKKDFNTLFPPILRIATFQDKAFAKKSEEREEAIVKTTQACSDNLKLNMKVLNAHLDVDEDKVLITFTAEQRVDFRELVKILCGEFRLRIELRQIGPRDQARVIGGLGPCGLPLCCSTFLKSFDGISISMAKNQLLAINIPKLSGQCGKLMCCLKFEDAAYSELRPLYPKIGEKFQYRNSQYEVTGLNLLNDTITAYNGENYETFSKEDFERVKKGLGKKETPLGNADINSGIDLSGHGIQDTRNRIERIKLSEEKRKDDVKNRQKDNQQKNRNSRQKPQQNRPFDKNKGQKNANQQHNNSNQHNSNNNRRTNFRNNQNQNKKPSSNSGFIPVSSIQDKSVLDFRPVKKDDKK